MKKLLLLLFLSATTFASAQRYITIVQLEASEGSTPEHPRVVHSYVGSDDGDFTYSSDYTESSVATYTFNLGIPPHLFTTPTETYHADLGFLNNISQFHSNLGIHGTFLTPGNRPAVLNPADILEINPYDVLVGWEPGTGVSEDRRWTYYACDGNSIFMLSLFGNGFAVTEITGRVPSALSAAGYPASTHAGTVFGNLEDVIDAVNNRVAELSCGSCVNSSADYNRINSLIVAADAGFYFNDFTSWTDRETREDGFLEASWNEIHVDGDQFVLIIETGGDGLSGTSTSYDCLEDLLDAL